MPREKAIRIYPSGQNWIVKKDGAERASIVTNTKTEAMAQARQIALNQGLVMIVHGKDGKIQKTVRPKESEEEGCFLTTACCNYYGLNDNCYQLQTLRDFRDTYLTKTDSNKILIQQYYAIAPLLVKLLDQDSKKKDLYSIIFQEIDKACYAIEKKQYAKAKQIYIKTVVQLLGYFKFSYKWA